MTDKPKTNRIKFKINDHLLRLINSGCMDNHCTDNEYLSTLLKEGLNDFKTRIEHENPSKVLAHMQDAMDFFKFAGNELASVDFERSFALELKLTSKEFEKDLVELTTMFICYAILRH